MEYLTKRTLSMLAKFFLSSMYLIVGTYYIVSRQLGNIPAMLIVCSMLCVGFWAGKSLMQISRR